MTLTSELAAYREKSDKELFPETRRILEEAAADLDEKKAGENAMGVGDKFPDATLTDHLGQPWRFKDALGNGPLLVVFYRGGWCPYCNLELRAYQTMLPDILGSGGQLVAVSPEPPDGSLSTIEKNALEFPVLTDTRNELAQALGIVIEMTPELQGLMAGYDLDLSKKNADTGWTLPIPATFVVARDGTIEFAHVDRDYRERAEPEEARQVLQRL